MYDIRTWAEMEVIHLSEPDAFGLNLNVALAIPRNGNLVLAVVLWEWLQVWRSRGNNPATLGEAWTHNVPGLT